MRIVHLLVLALLFAPSSASALSLPVPQFPDFPDFPDDIFNGGLQVGAVRSSIRVLAEARGSEAVRDAVDGLLGTLAELELAVGAEADFPEKAFGALVRALETFSELAAVQAKADSGQKLVFVRGDANSDEQVDLSDARAILDFLFLGRKQPECSAAADVNDSGDVDISDPMLLLNALFLGGPPPAAPHPSCGLDLTDDDLDCVAATCSTPLFPAFTHVRRFLGSLSVSVCFLDDNGECDVRLIPLGRDEVCAEVRGIGFCLWVEPAVEEDR